MSETLSMRVFSPDETAAGQDLLLVMPNEVATTLDDYHGARAQDVADTTGFHVLAYERPYSGSDQRYSWRRRQELISDSARVFSQTAAQLDRAIEREGPQRIYIAGHSAAAGDVIGIPHAEHTQFDGLVATDPASMRRTRRFAEITDYGKYQLVDERHKPEPTESERYENTQEAEQVPAAQMLRRTIGELIVYGGYGSSPESLRLLKELATKQRQLSIAVVFPEHTFTTDREQQLAIKEALESIRDEGDAPLDVDLLDGKYHSTFNDYKLFGGIVLEKVLKYEAQR